MVESNRKRFEATVVWCIDSPGFGGSEINFIRVLEMAGPKHSAVIHGEKVSSELESFLEKIAIPTQPNPARNSWKHSLRSIFASLRLIRRFSSADFIVWSHHSDSNRWLQLTLALFKRRFVIIEQVVPVDRQSFAFSRLSIPLKRFIAPRAYWVILNSRTQVAHYTRIFHLKDCRLVVIPNTRPVFQIKTRTTELRAEKKRLQKSLGITGWPVILSVARLAEQKGQRDLIRAMVRLAESARESVLVLVGDGPDRSFLEALARDISLRRVVFAGNQDDPLPWLAAADVFVLPSLYEGLPGALIEAMAAGLPCIATDIPGNRDLIKDGQTGLLVPVNNFAALADAIKRIVSDPELALRCAQAGYELVAREFDESTERTAWSSLISELSRECENN
jgi:glycosyltransferase involved in cell wall biosynthesis